MPGGGDHLVGRRVLRHERRRAGLQRAEELLVAGVHGEHHDAHRGRWPCAAARVASRPLPSGSRTSMITTSGCERADRRERFGDGAGLADDLEVVGPARRHAAGPGGSGRGRQPAARCTRHVGSPHLPACWPCRSPALAMLDRDRRYPTSAAEGADGLQRCRRSAFRALRHDRPDRSCRSRTSVPSPRPSSATLDAGVRRVDRQRHPQVLGSGVLAGVGDASCAMRSSSASMSAGSRAVDSSSDEVHPSGRMRARRCARSRPGRSRGRRGGRPRCAGRRATAAAR